MTPWALHPLPCRHTSFKEMEQQAVIFKLGKRITLYATLGGEERGTHVPELSFTVKNKTRLSLIIKFNGKVPTGKAKRRTCVSK